MWQRRDDDVGAFHLVRRSQAQRTAARRVNFLNVARRRNQFTASRIIRAFDVFHELADSRLGIIDQMDQGAGHFVQIVRRDIRRHADSDTGRAVE